MPLLIRNITLNLDEPEDVLISRAAHRLKLPTDAIVFWSVVRRSIDARAGRIRLVYNVELALDAVAREQRLAGRLHRGDVTIIEPQPTIEPSPGTEPMSDRPVIVGFGPAGMFAALMLAEQGYRPVVLERGKPVEQRDTDVMRRFWRNGEFDPESNMLFGEGGAGCYSDGKLRTRINDPRVAMVLRTMYRFGADPDILIDSKPHVGSDRLPDICRRIRQHVEQLGGEVRFGRRVEGIDLSDGDAVGIRLHADQTMTVRSGSGASAATSPVLMGIGHSARDTFRTLSQDGVELAAKPFQLGVRIEHAQHAIDRWQYGSQAGHSRLDAASYQVVAKRAGGTFGDVFSFCMCPGGRIVPCNESAGLVAVNGASRSNRDAPTGNSGLVVTMKPDEVGDDPLAVLAMLEDLERKAFEAGGGDYRVPVQRASDFVAGRASDGEMGISYPLGGGWCELASVLPANVAESLSRALRILDRRMPGFAGPNALLAAPETRASCPIRIVRDMTTRASVSARNLYPIGEGAGYAGGIVSSAVDGLRSAEAIIARYAPPR